MAQKKHTRSTNDTRSIGSAAGNTVENKQDPRLDPQSEQFDKEYFESNQAAIEEALNAMKKTVDSANKVLSEIKDNNSLYNTLSILSEVGEAFVGLEPIIKDAGQDVNTLFNGLIANFPSREYVEEQAIANLGYGIKRDALMNEKGISVEEYKNTLEGTDNPIYLDIENRSIKFSKLFLIAFKEELKRPAFEGWDFFSLYDECTKIENDTFFILEDTLLAEVVNNAIEKIETDEKSLKRAEQTKRSKETRAARELAINTGALTKPNGNLVGFSSDNLKDAFNAFNISILEDEIRADDFNSEGAFKYDSTSQLPNAHPMQGIETPILMAVLKYAMSLVELDDYYLNTSTTIPIHTPSFFEWTQIEVRPFGAEKENIDLKEARKSKMLEYLLPFEKAIGKLPNGSFYRVLTVQEYDIETETVVISSPYIFKALEMAETANATNKRLMQYNKLLDPTALSGKNKAAFEVALYLLNALLSRGVTNPKKVIKKDKITGEKNEVSIVVYDVYYRTIINACPQFNLELTEIKEKGVNVRQNTNNKLKRTFAAAFKIIKTKSTAYQYFEGLNIQGFEEDTKKPVYPTITTLDEKLVITFEKLNRETK